MRILVTNDDGVAAPGLEVAEAIARDVAGPGGEVWIVAPAFEQSGVGHALTYNGPIQAEQLGERRFAVSGTPADCVILGCSAFMAGTPPDLVLSGVNRGHNLAEDAVVSGTLGGALEGALQGVRAIALSQYYRTLPLSPEEVAAGVPAPAPIEDRFHASRAHGAETVAALLQLDWSKDLFFNVNFPATNAETVKGRRTAPQGRRASPPFGSEERVSPSGRRYFWLRHRVDNRSAAPETDAALCADGWITIAPMIADYTDQAALDRLRGQIDTPGGDGA